MIEVAKDILSSIIDWAKELKSEKKLERFMCRRIGPTEITQVHGILDTDTRWLKFVEKVIANHPCYNGPRNPIEALTRIQETLPSSQKVESLYTIMSLPPEHAGFPPSIREEDPHADVSRVEKLGSKLFPTYAYVGATTKRESSLSFPSFQREFAYRTAALTTGLGKTIPNLKRHYKWDFDAYKSQGEIHSNAILQKVFAILFAVVWRGQPAPPGKEYIAFMADGSVISADRKTAYGKFVKFRFRVPVGGPGYANLPFGALNAGVRRGAEEARPFIFKHRGSNHLSQKVNEFAAGEKIWFLAVDLKQMEYSMHTQYVRTYHEIVDDFLDKSGFGYSRLLYVNAPTAAPNFDDVPVKDWKNKFLVTHPFDYRYEDNIGLGNRSGSFVVTDVNKLAGVDCMIELLKEALKISVDVDDLESGSRFRLLNLGDDNLFLFKRKQDAMQALEFLQGDPTVAGFKVSVEPAPSFLKYYVMHRNGRYEFVKDASTFISNLVVSEHGTNTTAEDIANLGKSDDVDPGIGYFARQLDYASNELCIDEIRPWFEGLLKSELKLEPAQAYPTSATELKKLIEAHPGGSMDSVDAIAYLLKLNPDYIFYKLDSSDIPKELLDSMFLHITIEQMKSLVPGLPMKYKSSDDIPIHANNFDKLDEDSRARVLNLLKSYL